MKDIKSYVIGFLTCACLFLIMGQGYSSIPPVKDNWEIYSYGDAPNDRTFLLNKSTGVIFTQYKEDRKKFFGQLKLKFLKE